MDIKIADDIIKLLEYLFAKMGIAIDWSADNIMPYLMELGSHIVSYKMWCAIIIICAVLVSFIIVWSLCNMWKKVYPNNEDVCIYTIIIKLAITVVMIITISVQSITIVKCKTFPEIVVRSEEHTSELQSQR